VRTKDGEVTAKELKRRTAKSLELRSLNVDHSDRVIPTKDVAWMARVMWARQ
jgi:phage repressor protein C with HTH and peptisase S24 domain